VSDRANALIKLATEGLGCVSLPDRCHALRAFGQPISKALGRQQAALAQPLKAATTSLGNAQTEASRLQVETVLRTLTPQQATLTQAQQQDQAAMRPLTLSLHPFTLDTHEVQTFGDLTTALQTPLAQIRQLGQTDGAQQALPAIAAVEQPIPDRAQGLPAGWRWPPQALAAQTASIEIPNWVITVRLPWVYWLQQTAKTPHSELNARYQQAADTAAQKLLAHPLTQSLLADQRQSWIDWAQWMANHDQRTSSAVEGRNGALTRLHHAGRGCSPQTLKGLTMLHNFHLQRPDRTPAAQRLFDYKFPDLFEWVTDPMGDLPLARRALNSHPPNPFHLEGFPA
jgi:Family of unknown function (DUF6399)